MNILTWFLFFVLFLQYATGMQVSEWDSCIEREVRFPDNHFCPAGGTGGDITGINRPGTPMPSPRLVRRTSSEYREMKRQMLKELVQKSPTQEGKIQFTHFLLAPHLYRKVKKQIEN